MYRYKHVYICVIVYTEEHRYTHFFFFYVLVKSLGGRKSIGEWNTVLVLDLAVVVARRGNVCRIGRGSCGQVLLRNRCSRQSQKHMACSRTQLPRDRQWAWRARISQKAPKGGLSRAEAVAGGRNATVSQDPCVACRSGGCESVK